MKDRKQFINELMNINWDLQTLELTLRFKGKTAEAEEVWQTNTRLGTEIDILIGQAMDQWSNKLPQFSNDLDKCVTNVDNAIANIKKDVQLARNISALAGYVDDVLAIVAKIVV